MQWKIKVNCDRNKTECLVILPLTAKNKDRNDSNFKNFKKLHITGKDINFASSTTVLGLIIDDKLLFDLHAGNILKKCWFSWYKLTRNSNRYFGLNLSSTVILFKTVVLSTLMYAAPVWLNYKNQAKFKDFYARVCLKISGSTHYPPQGVTLFTMGLEPLTITYTIVCTKFILKSLSSDASMKGLIYQLEESRQHPFYHHIVMVRNYLSLKGVTANNVKRITSFNLLEHCNDPSLVYQESDIRSLRLKLWNKYFSTDADIKSINTMTSGPDHINDNGIAQEQSLTVYKTLFPRTSKRSTDTKTMSLLHGHDLTFNIFKHSLNLSPSPCLRNLSWGKR